MICSGIAAPTGSENDINLLVSRHENGFESKFPFVFGGANDMKARSLQMVWAHPQIAHHKGGLPILGQPKNAYRT